MELFIQELVNEREDLGGFHNCVPPFYNLFCFVLLFGIHTLSLFFNLTDGKYLINMFTSFCSQMTSLEQVGEEVVGQARCPFESVQSNVGLFAGESKVT